MPSVRYYNNTAPFWDFVANLEEQGLANRSADNNNTTENNEQPDPWTHPWAQQQGWGAGFPFGGPFAHRGRHGPPGPPPPPAPEHDHAPPPPESEKEGEPGPSEPRGPPPPFSEHGPHHGGPGAHRGRCGGRGRGGWGGRGRGGPRHSGNFPPFMGGFGNLAQMFQDQLFDGGESKDKAAEDFKPEADVFDTPESFVIHISLPGAKKEDVGVNWDAEKSELNVAGVIYRPGDEEFLKTLALDERKVGAFERKVRLGSRANPAQVDMDDISARMEDGVLRIEVPKLDGGFVEVRKVDIE